MADPIDTEGKPYWFDLGTPDMLNTCSSCHIGGGPFEGIVQADGTVIPYDDPSLTPTNTYDRDFYSFDANANAKAFYDSDTIAGSVAAAGVPQRHDWQKSGVMEADCMMCHIDPEHPQVLTAADGLKVDPNRPRMMIFAERNEAGEVVKVSLGTPLATGLDNEAARPYTNPLQRANRPTNMNILMQLPPQNVGDIMQMWVDGLAAIDLINEASGTTRLPYALYGLNVDKIWDSSSDIRAEYCPNPDGPEDEMLRLTANKSAIDDLFEQFLQYMKANALLAPEATMDDMMAMFFNDFIYAYQIKNPMDPMEGFMPLPFGLRAYDRGRFYTDWDDPQSSTRDYMRQPRIEGEGGPYVGRVGLAWQAKMYGMGLAMEGDDTYIDVATGQVMNDQIIADWQSGVIEKEDIEMVLHDELPSFYGVMATAELMGLDLNQNGSPLTYIQLVKDEASGEWFTKTYYEVDEIMKGNIHVNMFGGKKDANDPKWTKICGQCHVMLSDHGNSELEIVRKYNLGMSADWVKNGTYINMTTDQEASGYDVHMSEGKMGCGSCHLRQPGYHRTGNLEDMHNFLKGTDTGHNVRNDLDNNFRPKNCEQCHSGGIDPGAANPAVAHEAKFGAHTAVHMEKISCQACHVPFKKTWRYRAFDDTLSYYNNFDNRSGYDVLPGGNGKLMAYQGEYALSPVYGPSPGYGVPHFNMLTQHIEADGSGQVPMDYVSGMVDYFHLSKSSDPGRIVNGMATNPRFDFCKYLFQKYLQIKQAAGVPLSFDPEWDNEAFPPLYWGNGTNGYPQIVVGNPITIMTWVDANPDNGDHDMSSLAYGGAKVLYLREMIAAISEYYAPTSFGVDPSALKDIPSNDAAWAQSSMVGRLVLKESGYVIFDHTGDMAPEIWHVEDVRAMQAALKIALMAEGVKNPMPMLFMAAHYFSDTHGVQPKEKALGAVSCNDCHGDLATDSGAHRVTDRLINFLPWAPPWFNEANRLLKYNAESGNMEGTGETGTDGKGAFFIVDGEVDYIKPVSGNGLEFLGAKAEDVLSLSHHHAKELFYMHHGEATLGSAIKGLILSRMTAAEAAESYVPQVTVPRRGGLRDSDWIPEELRHAASAFGFVPVTQAIEIVDNGTLWEGDAKVFVYGLNVEHLEVPEDATKGIIVKLDLADGLADYSVRPRIAFQPADAAFDDPWTFIDDLELQFKERRGQIVRFAWDNENWLILRAGPGRYAAVYATDTNVAAVPDCNGVAGGHLVVDSCGTCDSDPFNDCVEE